MVVSLGGWLESCRSHVVLQGCVTICAGRGLGSRQQQQKQRLVLCVFWLRHERQQLRMCLPGRQEAFWSQLRAPLSTVVAVFTLACLFLLWGLSSAAAAACAFQQDGQVATVVATSALWALS